MDIFAACALAGLGLCCVGLYRKNRLLKRANEACRTQLEKADAAFQYYIEDAGFSSILTLSASWKQLCYRLGYALHHADEFKPSYLLRHQLGLAGSLLRRLSNNKQHIQHGVARHLCVAAERGVLGGFREAGEGFTTEEYDEEQLLNLEAEMWLMLEGMDAVTVARVCCYILDGFTLEGAMLRAGICVYSPTGKATALGKVPANMHGFVFHP